VTTAAKPVLEAATTSSTWSANRRAVIGVGVDRAYQQRVCPSQLTAVAKLKGMQDLATKGGSVTAKASRCAWGQGSLGIESSAAEAPRFPHR
jgi:hypothetical protein